MKCNYFMPYVIGQFLTFAYDDLSYKKVATQSRTKVGMYYDAYNAVDRNTATCMRTDEIGNNSEETTMWWKVNLGRIYNIYSINVLFKDYAGHEMRQRGRFAGFSLYVSKTDVSDSSAIKGSPLCYKDGPDLPPLNFTTTCTKHGKYVIYYNERLGKVSYPRYYEMTNLLTELCEVIVQGCNQSNVYGEDCVLPCPLNCQDNTCHIQYGTCFACNDGWTGTYCNNQCKNGWYGANCSRECGGHCRYKTSCNHVTGQCAGGCAAGWTNSKCDKECIDGTYGYDCVNNCSGNCLNDFPCNKKTGHCDGGCKPGYTNGDCKQVCSSGHFGNQCGEICSAYCKGNEPCNYINGICPVGCQDGYIGQQCIKTCKEGLYGENCSFVCSLNCKTCRHTDGLCSCKEGWTGPNCTTECTQSYGEDCKNPCSVHCINQTCNRFNGSCLYDCKDYKACEKGSYSTFIDTPSSLHLSIGGTIGAFVVLIIGTVIAVSVIRFKQKSKSMAKRESIVLEAKPRFKKETIAESYLNDRTSRYNKTKSYLESKYALPEKTKRGPPTNKNISVRNILAQIANMSADGGVGFKREYNDIPRGELHPCTEGKRPENKIKNRYTTVFPYDHSRIVLRPAVLVEHGYINANYIEDSRDNRAYIATQGPKPKTIADFWTMVWQENVVNIVCLTNLTEGTKNKCAKYWPDINDKLQGGTLTIRHLEEKIYAEYIIRQFKIHNKTTKTDRHVAMFHYTTWSDHGVADPLSLVVFYRHVIRATANSAGKYTVVHCSAGVGRTGTYIALDALYREGERTGKINVPMYVRTMRKDRMNMIQGDEQYKLLYLTLKEAFSGPSRCMTTEKFLGAYQEQTCYANCGDVVQKSSHSSEFEELLSLRKEYTQQDYISGRAQIAANYTQTVLPVEEFTCHLSYIKGHNTYYNAVLLQSHLEKDSLISAQYPLPDNTEDFLRLIKDFDARVVVFLCPLKDIESTPAWFPTDNQSKLNGLFFIKNISTTKASNVTMSKLNIQPQGFSEINITVIECPTWREGKGTADKRMLLDVIKAVKTEKSDQEGRIIVLSSDGATRCGPFFVVYNVLEQISVDREVDIFTTTRQLQVRRPEFMSTLEEYQLCHDTVAEYLLNDCVYGNC